MNKSFYHYMMKHRHVSAKNEIEVLANEMYEDHAFPKQSFEYNTVSSYLELSSHFQSTMSTFDRAWEMYERDE
ncbi:MAG: YozE family protein [Bacillaceae bacterium]